MLVCLKGRFVNNVFKTDDGIILPSEVKNTCKYVTGWWLLNVKMEHTTTPVITNVIQLKFSKFDLKVE